jgi:parallel beta-helix repeat protein
LASSRSQPIPLASTPAYTAHSPLNITGNADLLFQNASEPFCWAGTGIENDPYIIEGLNITLRSGATTPALSLTNTTFYFILRTSWLDGAHQYQAGVYLDNVTHGTIANNTIKNHFSGIRLAANCTNNTITRNTVFNCTNYGLIVEEGSENNSVTWNAFLHNNQGGPQAWDGGKWNHYDYNHWNDQVSPDGDTDGLVDAHYPIGENPVLSFDGTNDIITIPNDASLDLTDNMTIELWLKTSVIPSDWARLVGKGGLDTRNYAMWIAHTAYPTPGIIHWQISYQDGITKYATVDSTTVVTDGSWHHVAGTFNGSAMALYIDGAFEADVAFPAGKTPDITSDAVILGYGNVHNYYNGLMDEVRILNRTLTAAEIQADFAAPAHYPVRNGTVAWYHLNEATGTTVTDSSGNGNQGIISGAGWRRDRGANPALAFWGDFTNGGYVDTTDFALDNNFTIELWAAPSNPAQAAWQILIGKHDSIAINQFLLGNMHNNYTLDIFLGSNWHGYEVIRPATTGWQHLVIVGNVNTTHTNITFYGNGQVLDHRALLGRINNAPGISGLPWTFAQEYDAGPVTRRHFTGWLDEIRFLNRSLSAKYHRLVSF